LTYPVLTSLRSRRQALRAGVAALVALGVPRLAFSRGRDGACPWTFDINGDGTVSAADRALIADAGFAMRGDRTSPRSNWDPRLDFLSRGRLLEDNLAEFDRLAPALATQLPPRPITACWHYGWYGPGRRQRETPTMRYIGGNYLSTDRRTEETFNNLKNEFGISADMLSWIDNRDTLRAFERGYLSASNRGQRRFGLLYESQINLEARGRISMSPARRAPTKLAHDFRRMGQWLRDVAGPDRDDVLRIDGRPVIYLYGSHTFGVNNAELPDVGTALVRARDDFAAAFGALPYLVGDESIFPGDAEVALDRRFRAQYFDAITRYHHYDERQVRELGGDRAIRLDADHIARIVALEQRNNTGFAGTRNRWSDQPIVTIPSMAAGFAKRGLPSFLVA